MSLFGVGDTEGMGLDELFQNPNNGPDGTDSYYDWENIDPNLLDLGLDHETAQGAKGFQSVVHGDQGIQNSQEAKHAQDVADAQGIHRGVVPGATQGSTQGTDLYTDVSTANISAFGDRYATDNMLRFMDDPFVANVPAQNTVLIHGVALDYSIFVDGLQIGSMPASLQNVEFQFTAVRDQLRLMEVPVDRKYFSRPAQHIGSSPVSGHQSAPASTLRGVAVPPDSGLDAATDPVNTYEIGMYLEPESSGVATATLFSSFEEARQATAPVPTPNMNDPTIPYAPEQQKAIVRALCDAISSVHLSEDSEAVNRPFIEGKYSRKRIEAAAWTVLHACISHHENGPLRAPYGIKPKGTAKLQNFAQRMTEILHCIEKRKTVCKHLLDAPYVYNLVDDPVGFMKRIISNKNLNMAKGKAIKAGVSVLKKQKEEEERQREEEALKEEEDADFEDAQFDDADAILNLQHESPDHVTSDPSILSPPESCHSSPPLLNGTGFSAIAPGPGPMSPPQRLPKNSVLASANHQTPMTTPTKTFPSSTPASRKRRGSEVDFAVTGSAGKRKQL